MIHPIAAFGDDAQLESWLPDLIAGGLIGCFGLTERDFGSDPASMRTSARDGRRRGLRCETHAAETGL